MMRDQTHPPDMKDWGMGSIGLRLAHSAMITILALCSLQVLLQEGIGAEGEKALFTRTEDVVYGRKFGTALTLDVFTPAQPNGYGILFMVSGGFFSSHEAINPQYYRPYLEEGYTVFAVVHGSQPRFIIPEIVQDIHRAVRFVRHHAARYGIRPDKLGITGASAGGHLSLTMGTQGGPGKPDAKDPIDRESSSVQAVACFFPPTDYLNWSGPGDDAVGVGTLKNFQPAFGPRSESVESRRTYGREISPFYFVTSNMAPSLIIHGDADKLVPVEQAHLFRKKAEAQGAVCRVMVRPGLQHGWLGIEKDQVHFVEWFNEYLRGVKSAPARH